MSRIQLIVRTSLQIALLSVASVATAQQEAEADPNAATDNTEAATQNEDVSAEAQSALAAADETPTMPEAVQQAPVVEPEAPAAEPAARAIAHPAPVVEQAVAALEPPVAAPTPAAPIKLDTPEDLRRRIEKAREIVEIQRKRSPPPEEVPTGLSREELELRAGERNIAAYDKQINTGEGTDAIAAFRKLAVETVSATRRRQYAKVFGDAIHDPDAPALFRAHAQRMAQLRRIRMFAEIKRFPALAKQADQLMARSEEWLKERMQALQAPPFAQKDMASNATATEAAPK
jgi:hypothetical protein